MRGFLKHRGHLGTVEYSAEDDLLHGHISGVQNLISYSGRTLEELKKGFVEAVDLYLESCDTDFTLQKL